MKKFTMDTRSRIISIIADLGELEESVSLDSDFNYVEADFFDSLFVLSLIAQVDQDFGIVLNASDIFLAPTVSTLTALIEKNTSIR